MKGSGEHDETIDANPRSTIEPDRKTLDDAGHEALARLARMQRGALTIGDLLGEGGMGMVHLATQTALGRKVAVKTLRAELRGPTNTMQLLREAWITGALEHPNVVPVYDVSLDASGAPIVVLRRIEGTEWSSLMPEPELVAKRYGAHDLLEWNLRVLMQVCNAVHFAHQRGILHRDLKPENVMLGELGEVYLLDWGIAVATDDDGTGRLPLRKDATQPAGTPAYMAPEMWSGDPTQLSPRTDVYLLGAILCEILTGRPPHSGSNLAELRAHAPIMPPLPPSPAELVALCRRALDPEPAQRPSSALAMRRALEDFLGQQEAGRLVDEAQRGLARLRATIAAEAPVRSEVYSVFGATRFGFEQALARIPDARGAREGLVEAITAMVEYELTGSDPRAAETLLAGLSDAPAELRARVGEAALAHAAEEGKRRALEALGRNWDTGVGQRTRLFLGVVIGVVWTILPIVGVLTDRFPRTHRGEALVAGLFTCASIAVAYWARDSLLRTRLNRGILAAIILTPVSQLLLVVGCSLMGVGPLLVPTLQMFLWFTICAVLGATIDARLLIAATSYLAGFLVTARWPGMKAPMMAGGNFMLTVSVLIMWLPGLRGRVWAPVRDRFRR